MGTPPLTFNLAVEYAPARPLLEIAHRPEEVPPWDWTRGWSPWERMDVGPTLARWANELSEEVAPLVRAMPEFAQREFVQLFAPPPVPPSLRYPRLVRAWPGEGVPVPAPQHLYMELYDLFRATAHPPESRHFANAARRTAMRVGLLDPYGTGDDLAAWHEFAQEVGFFVDLLRALQDLGDLEAALEAMSPPWPGAYGRHRDRWQNWCRQARLVGMTPAPDRIVRELYQAGFREILPHLEHTPDGRVKAPVGSRAWVRLELAQAFTERRVRFCPVCGAPFLGRADRETCRSDRCRKAWYRKKKRSK